MLTRRLHHTSFTVRDLARARRFYEDVLGLEQIERPDLGLPGVWYGIGDAQIHLIEMPAGGEPGSRAPGLTPLAPHTAFAIDDYAATLAHLRAHDLPVIETSPEMGQMWVQDPDGYVVELIAAR